MNVPYNYLPMEFEDNSSIFEEWKALIRSTEFTLGSFLNRFEEKFSERINSKHCIAVNNGTDALILSLKAAGVGKGDHVITVTNTFYATVGAIVAVGATPVLVDCDGRFQISVEEIERNITEKTKAVMPVHWGGASPDIIKIKKICDQLNIVVIEDACMGIGALVNGRSPGTFGLVNAFSMHPLKSLNAMGDGGMVATESDELATWMRKYRNHGMVDRDHIDFWGVNLRMQPLQCVVLSQGLDRLDETINRRNENATYLDSMLMGLDEVNLPKRIDTNIETFALYMGLFERRDSLISYLIESGIEAKVHYPLPLHKQKAALKDCIYDESNLSNAEYQADHLITLPIHQFLTRDQLEYMAEKISDFYHKR